MNRIKGLMAKLEDEYNTQLDNAQTQISAAVERVGGARFDDCNCTSASDYYITYFIC